MLAWQYEETMEEDEIERNFEAMPSHPMSYAFEPLRRQAQPWVVLEEEQLMVSTGAETVGDTAWTLQGNAHPDMLPGGGRGPSSGGSSLHHFILHLPDALLREGSVGSGRVFIERRPCRDPGAPG